MKTKKVLAVLLVIVVCAIVVQAGHYLWIMQSNQNVNIENMASSVWINGEHMPCTFEEEINISAGDSAIMNYSIQNNANHEFTINVSAEIDNPDLSITGLQEYVIPAKATTWVNLTYTVDLWTDTTTATVNLTFDIA